MEVVWYMHYIIFCVLHCTHRYVNVNITVTNDTQERIAEHLQKHAGEGDVLDSLVTHFSGSLTSGVNDAAHGRGSGGPK